MRKPKPRRLKSNPHPYLRCFIIILFAAAVLFAVICKCITHGMISLPNSLIDAAFSSTLLSAPESGTLYAASTPTPSAIVTLPDSSAADTHASEDASLSVYAVIEPSATPSPTPAPNAADLSSDVRTITVSPSSSEAGASYAGVFIKNETDYDIDVRSYLESELPDALRSAPQHIIIVHTHASEAFYSDGEDAYEATDAQHTEDTDCNVIRLGDTLAEILEARGFKVTHIREIFDYPSYTGSYTRALAALEAAIQENPDACAVIDIHRDAIVSADGSIYRVVSDTNRGRAAQMMLVVGTDENGLSHDDWRRNLTFAIHLQKYLIDSYPDLMRPIAVSRSRYNQHLTEGSLILEIGASGNTLDEAILSATIFAEQLCDFFSDISQ